MLRKGTFALAEEPPDAILYEFCVGAQETVELGAAWQGGEGRAQVSLGVAVEVPLASEATPAGKDSQGQQHYVGGGLW